MTARTGRDPSRLFTELTDELGVPYYERIDAPRPRRRRIC
jgi:phosphoglucomutase